MKNKNLSSLPGLLYNFVEMETNAETNAAAESNHEPQAQQQYRQDHDWQ